MGGSVDGESTSPGRAKPLRSGRVRTATWPAMRIRFRQGWLELQGLPQGGNGGLEFPLLEVDEHPGWHALPPRPAPVPELLEGSLGLRIVALGERLLALLGVLLDCVRGLRRPHEQTQPHTNDQHDEPANSAKNRITKGECTSKKIRQAGTGLADCKNRLPRAQKISLPPSWMMRPGRAAMTLPYAVSLGLLSIGAPMDVAVFGS